MKLSSDRIGWLFNLLRINSDNAETDAVVISNLFNIFDLELYACQAATLAVSKVLSGPIIFCQGFRCPLNFPTFRLNLANLVWLKSLYDKPNVRPTVTVETARPPFFYKTGISNSAHLNPIECRPIAVSIIVRIRQNISESKDALNSSVSKMFINCIVYLLFSGAVASA